MVPSCSPVFAVLLCGTVEQHYVGWSLWGENCWRFQRGKHSDQQTKSGVYLT